MTRIPTYATYINMMNQTIRNKETFDLYNFQSITGLKSQSYSGYGMSAYSIVSLEASLTVTNNFMENNKVLTTELKTMSTSLDAVSKSINEFKSMLTSFSGMDLEDITPDYTGGEITFKSDTPADYLNKNITIDGVKYTFTDNDTPVDGSEVVNINGLTSAEDIMNALYAKVQAQVPNNPDIKVEGSKMTFPLYTVNGTSTVLADSNVVETGTPHEMNQDQYLNMQQLQNQAFASLKMLVDSLNTFANGKYLFGGGVSKESPVDFPFTTLEEFQSYYDGINITYPTNSSANLSNYSVNAEDTGAITLHQNPGTNTGTITAEKAGGFLKENISANDKTTGKLTFNADKNTINATEYGAFNTLSEGDTIVIGGDGAGNNAKAYVIKSISTDGKTITVSEDTPIVEDLVVTPDNTAANKVTFSSSFPVGAIINMDGFNNRNIASNVQVTGISDDGSTLYVTADPDRFPDMTIPASSKWSLNSESYYKGGDLSSEKRISENQSITLDINAKDPAFEKLFRALGQIAQGNLVDTRNPAEGMDTLIDINDTINRVTESLDLIQSAIFNSGENASVKNADLYTVTAKVNSSSVILNSVSENQTLVKSNLENNITSLKNVDKTEATVKALLAYNNLAASYSVLQQATSLSLLNYLK